MSRLVGKQQTGGLSLSILAIVALGVLGALEYSGVTNFIATGSTVGIEQNLLNAPQANEENVNHQTN